MSATSKLFRRPTCGNPPLDLADTMMRIQVTGVVPVRGDLRGDRDSFDEAMMVVESMAAEGDWARAATALEAALHEARIFEREQAADEAGMAK